MLKAYKNLSPKARMGVGVAIIAWGGVGLYLSDQTERHLGYVPSEKDQEELRRMTPRITAVDRNDRP